MTVVNVIGRQAGHYVVNVEKDGKALIYGAVVSREALLKYREKPGEYEVRLCDSTIRL